MLLGLAEDTGRAMIALRGNECGATGAAGGSGRLSTWPRRAGAGVTAGDSASIRRLWQSGHCAHEIDAASCNWGQLVFLRV